MAGELGWDRGEWGWLALALGLAGTWVVARWGGGWGDRGARARAGGGAVGSGVGSAVGGAVGGAGRAGGAAGGRGWVLVGLRVVVVWLLAAVVAGPVWRRGARAEETGGVVVLADVSGSMGVADTQRGPAERLRAAEALGWWTPGDAAEVAEWRRRVEGVGASVERVRRAWEEAEAAELARADPRPARAKLSAARAELVRLVRMSGSEGPGGAGRELPASVRRALEGLGGVSTGGGGAGSSAGSEAGAGSEAEAGGAAWVGVARRVVSEAWRALEAERDVRLARTVWTDARAAEAARRVGEAARWELGREAVAAAGGVVSGLPRGTPVRFVAFDSGRRESAGYPERASGAGTDLATAVAEAASGTFGGRRPAAVLVVSDGRGVLGADGANEQARVDRATAGGVRVMGLEVSAAGEPAGVRVTAWEVPGTGAMPMVVGERGRVRVVLAGAGGAAAGAEAEAGSVGVWRVRVRVEVAGQTQSREVEVAAGEERAEEFDLLAERAGEWPVELRAEWAGGRRVFRTVARAAARGTRVVVLTGADGWRGWDVQGVIEELRTWPWVRAEVVPAGGAGSAGTLEGAEAVVVAGVGAGELVEAGRAALAGLVRERGGGMLLLPDAEKIPGEWARDGGLSAWVAGAGGGEWEGSLGDRGEWAVGGGIRVGGRAEQRAYGEGGRVSSPYRGIRGGPAEGVRVVVEGPDAGRALVVEQESGRGRVVLARTDQMWRWRAGGSGGDRLTEVLGRVVERPYAAASDGAKLDAWSEGGVLWVRCRVEGGMLPRVTVAGEGGAIREVAMTSEGGGRWVGRAAGLAAGEWTVTARGASGEATRLTVAVGEDVRVAELARLAGDAAELRRSCPDGVFSIAELPALRRALAEAVSGRGEMVTVRLWDHLGLAAAVLALLCAEWALRKHWGLG